VEDGGDPAKPRRNDDRNCYEAALRKNDGGFYAPYNGEGIRDSFYGTENIRNIFHVKVPPELTRRNGVVRGDAVFLFDQRAFDPVFTPRVMDFESVFQERGNEREVGRYMSRRSAAGQQYFFQWDATP
jgi:hypothetical protein